MIEIEAAALSDPSAFRHTNEDAIAAFAPLDAALLERKGFIYALADGVGGHQGGEVASATAVEAVIAEYYAPSNHSRIEPALKRAFEVANLRVYDLGQADPALRSMQTTLTALVLAGSQAYVAHVGDSRLYHCHEHRMVQVTADHSEVAELIRMRLVSPDRLRDHPRRNVLTRALGGQLIIRPDFLRLPVETGDQFLLCSDGLWSEVQLAEMEAVLAMREPDEACRELVDLALSKPCTDNVSVQVVKVLSTATERNEPREGFLSGVLQRMRFG